MPAPGVLVDADVEAAGGNIGLGRISCAGGGGDRTVNGRPSELGFADDVAIDDEDDAGLAGKGAGLMRFAEDDEEDGRGVNADEPETSRSRAGLLLGGGSGCVGDTLNVVSTSSLAVRDSDRRLTGFKGAGDSTSVLCSSSST